MVVGRNKLILHGCGKLSFEPCIRAGIIKAADLLGYRTH